MPNPIVECVPNFSEGRDQALLEKITNAIAAVPGVTLLDVDPGANTNRTVVTFVGPPDAVAEGAFQGVAKAAELIDMRRHHGEHPRMGATDVVPFVPVSDITMEECAEIARRVGRRIGEELGISVYLYEHAASRPERRNLSRVRSGQYEGMSEKLKDPEWKPDFGPTELNARAGVTAVGAREFLIAYNVDLNTTDRRYANEIAYTLRERGRWKRTGNTDPFYYKGEIVRFAVRRTLSVRSLRLRGRLLRGARGALPRGPRRRPAGALPGAGDRSGGSRGTGLRRRASSRT